MPITLTPSCAQTVPQLSISTKCATNDRKMPTQNTSSDCCPHLISGSIHFDSSRLQSFGTNRVMKNAITTKWITR
mgnify:CR=1 FL=1